MKKVTTTFYLNGRIKIFNGDSESDNLSQFLDEYSEATPELYQSDKNKIVTAIQRNGNTTINFIYRQNYEITDFLNCNFKSKELIWFI